MALTLGGYISETWFRSRRFRWDNCEYRWKRAGPDGKDLLVSLQLARASVSDAPPQCYDWWKRLIASYNEETKVLSVSDRGYAILDQVRHLRIIICRAMFTAHTTDRGNVPPSPLDVVIGPLVKTLMCSGCNHLYIVLCIALTLVMDAM